MADSRFRTAGSPPSAITAQSTEPLERPATRQVFRLTVRDNGDVRWTIESRFLITNESEETVFREYAAEVTNNQRNVGYDLDVFEDFRRTAEQETGREMSIEDPGWDDPTVVESPNDTVVRNNTTTDDVQVGVISYSFTWTNFATVDGDRVNFGDAFRTENGVWFQLYDGQRLVVETPQQYALETPTQLSWDGPYEFDATELEIVFIRTSDSVIPMWGWLLGGLLFVVGFMSVGYLVVRRDGRTSPSIPTDRLPSIEAIGIATSTASDGDGTEAAESDGPDSPGRKPTGPTSSTGAAIDDDRNTGTSLEFEEPVGDAVDPELLSDEERVLRMLKQNGGRMKQASIVSETGWSNAKVSQLLSQMDDDDEIEKLRIGRENLITLPGVDPTEVD
ncbi:helix-turn-helix transcriptional regulator [Natrinema pellirubrum]